MSTITASLLALEKAGVARELTGQQRGRLFGYRKYIETLSQGTEPLWPNFYSSIAT